MLSLPRLRVRKKKEGFSKKKLCNTYGAIDGVKVGAEWQTRKECAGAGVHKPAVASIHAGPEGAYSIIISGRHRVQDNGINSRTKNDNGLGYWNMSLALSVKSKLPVRVVRSSKLNSPYAPKSGFRYDGIYTVIQWWREDIKGRVRYRFKMTRLEGQDPPVWGSLIHTTTEPYESDSEEPKILSSRHFRIQGEPRPPPHPTIEDIKPKVERINPLFAVTGSPLDISSGDIVVSDEEDTSFDNTYNKAEKTENIPDCFVDVDNLSNYSEDIEEFCDWSVQGSPPPEDCVYEEDYLESKEEKVDVNTVGEEGHFEEEENTVDEHPNTGEEVGYKLSIVPDNPAPNPIPVIHNTLSFAKSCNNQFPNSVDDALESDRDQPCHIFDGKYYILNNLSVVPEDEWEHQDEEIGITDEDPLRSQVHTPINYLISEKENSQQQSCFEKQEMSDSDDKTIHQMDHKCFFDISLRDIVKMVTEMAGCPCSWTNKQRLSASPSQKKPALPPLLLDYLKTILNMAESASTCSYPSIVTVTSCQEQEESVSLNSSDTSILPPPFPTPLFVPTTSPSVLASPPVSSSPPPLGSIPTSSSLPFPNTLTPTPILPSSPPLPQCNITTNSSDSTLILTRNKVSIGINTDSESCVSIGINTSSDLDMCRVEHSSTGTNTYIISTTSTSTMTDNPEENNTSSVVSNLNPHIGTDDRTEYLHLNDGCDVNQLPSTFEPPTLSMGLTKQSWESSDAETEEELDNQEAAIRKKRKRPRNDYSNEASNIEHQPLKKGKVGCKTKSKINCEYNEGSSKVIEECPAFDGKHCVPEIRLEEPFINLEEEWAQPHLYKVNISKTFEEICDELCRTLPENGERSRKKGPMSFSSRHNSNNHLKFGQQKRSNTVKRIRNRKIGFVGFTESQQRLSK